MPLCLHRFKKLAALVHLAFNENEIRGVWHLFDIIGQIRSGAFEESGILKHDQTPLREKRQRLRKVDDLPDIYTFPFIIGVIHRIPVREHRFYEPVLVLLLQIILLAVEKINLLKLSCF